MSLADRVRIWLGLDHVTSLQQMDEQETASIARHCQLLKTINQQHAEVMEAMTRIENRTVPKPRVTPMNPSTWEEIQAAYAANPKNFEESA